MVCLANFRRNMARSLADKDKETAYLFAGCGVVSNVVSFFFIRFNAMFGDAVPEKPNFCAKRV
jgi:hypothetical protein